MILYRESTLMWEPLQNNEAIMLMFLFIIILGGNILHHSFYNKKTKYNYL